MLQVGVFNGYFPYPLEEQAKKIKSIGLNTVQLDLAFKDVDFSTPDAITVAKAKRVRETFRDYNLPICCISGYTNIVHPDPAKRKEKLDYLRALIRNARGIDVKGMLGSTLPRARWRKIDLGWPKLMPPMKKYWLTTKLMSST
jgi:sugar phosphate isomerase/epimerase